MSEPIIHTEHLSRSFGAVKAVEDLSLEVPAGIVFGFLGPNGAGKTTTIHLLLGLLVPTQGQARVLGFDTRTQSNDIHAGCGALVSLHSPTVRQAQQNLLLSTLGLGVVLYLGLKALPGNLLSSLNTNQILTIILVVLAVFDEILLGIAFASFKQSRLILS